MTGHMMGAAGAFEAFATVMSVAEQSRPGTLNYRDSDPECDLWVVDETMPHAGPLRALEQHRPGRPQRRGDLQALRRRLRSATPGASPSGTTSSGPVRGSRGVGGSDMNVGGSTGRERLRRRVGHVALRVGREPLVSGSLLGRDPRVRPGLRWSSTTRPRPTRRSCSSSIPSWGSFGRVAREQASTALHRFMIMQDRMR